MSQDQTLKPSVAVPFAAIVLAMLPAVLDQTILATALPTIATDLGRISDVSWVVTAYVVSAAALTPLWGKLGERPESRLDAAGAALLAAATAAFMLVCIWGGDRYAWDSAQILGLVAVTVVLAVALVRRARRVPDPIVPLDMLRTPTVAVVSVALFLTTATIFAITVFVPLFVQTTTGASPTRAGLLLIPMMLGITFS